MMNKIYAKTFLCFFILTFSTGYLLSQTPSGETIKPILLDKEALSGLGLQKVKLKEEPERAFFQRRVFRGEDLSVYIVSSESWKTSFDNFSFDEFVYILNGRAKVNAVGGAEQTFNSHEFFAIPKGYTGTWEVMSGNNYHYELSVIATQRASETDTAPNKNPMLLDKLKVSGTDIQLDEDGHYETILFKGDELKISIKAEKPSVAHAMEVQNDQLLCILSGQVQITDFSGIEKSFYTGDFLVLPKGFKGSWKSNGHGLFKAIVVQ
ncbi:cupin domain-containing protein [Maribacter sp.]|nr:cupin domain-containing protein [Maribacter sp.]